MTVNPTNSELGDKLDKAVKREMDRIRAAIRQSSDGDAEDLITYAKEVTALRTRKSEALADDAVEQAKVPLSFIEAILHGDETHRAWLLEAAACWNSGQPVPLPRAALSTLAPSPAVDLLREAAKGLLARASDTYRKRNGHVSSIEADDGEKCWIVHSDDIDDLRRAVDAALKEAK